jgi:uncharacterized peroxidase-related enzyme
MGSADLARALALDPRTAGVDSADRAMLDYASKLTKTPALVSAADVDALRQNGFADAAILDICQVVAYYNYVNRLADGLGVELEEEWDETSWVLSRVEFESRHSAGDGG